MHVWVGGVICTLQYAEWVFLFVHVTSKMDDSDLSHSSKFQVLLGFKTINISPPHDLNVMSVENQFSGSVPQ